MSSLPELELSQLAGSSAGEAVERQEEEKLSQLVVAGSSAGDGVERQEEEVVVEGEEDEQQEQQEDEEEAAAEEGEEGLDLPAAAVPLAPAPDLSQPAGTFAGDSEMLEADVIFVPVANNWCERLLILPNPMAVRYVYAVLFAMMTVVAWTVRDIELSRFDHHHYGCDGSHDCIAANGVLRVSMGLAIFFLIMFVSTVNTRKRYEFRNFWHSQWWVPKAAIFFIGYGFAAYAPSSLLQFYGMVAHVGAWLFLVIQFFSVTSFIMWVNGLCRVESNRERWAKMTYGLLPLHAAPVILYLGSFVGLAFMYYWYAPSCEPTTGIYISVTASILCLMFLISCARKVAGGYLAPGMIMAYVVLMCWTTIRSEPHTETCNKKTKATTDWHNILSLVIAAVVIIASTYTTGKDSKCIQFSNRVELEDDIPYGYGFFHLVFALGAMYIGMLFVGWNAHRTMEKWTVDVSWASTRVRATSGLVVAICYILMLSFQDLWNLMLSVTSNLAPTDSEARPVGTM